MVVKETFKKPRTVCQKMDQRMCSIMQGAFQVRYITYTQKNATLELEKESCHELHENKENKFSLIPINIL
jgi:hypothetical protein